jgi:hypothetical protein
MSKTTNSRSVVVELESRIVASLSSDDSKASGTVMEGKFCVCQSRARCAVERISCKGGSTAQAAVSIMVTATPDGGA